VLRHDATLAIYRQQKEQNRYEKVQRIYMNNIQKMEQMEEETKACKIAVAPMMDWTRAIELILIKQWDEEDPLPVSHRCRTALFN
jgi:hypothetical protein